MTSFLLDGANVVQEQSGGAPSANVIAGGIDEIFTRTDNSGTVSLLTDGHGSTVGLTDSSASLQTEYTYDPFGNSQAVGLASTNPFQFTGRENDSAGLLFYRARYYNPSLHRFISQDSIGLSGGDTNLYGYAFNDPVNYADPSGQNALAIPWGAVGTGALEGGEEGSTFGPWGALAGAGLAAGAVILYEYEKDKTNNPDISIPDTAQPDPNGRSSHECGQGGSQDPLGLLESSRPKVSRVSG